MKKGVLILGIVYLIYGFLQLIVFSRLLGIYQSLNVNVPLVSYLFAGMFPVSGLILIVTYFLNLKAKTYMQVLCIFLLLGVLRLSYMLIGASVVNGNITRILENK